MAGLSGKPGKLTLKGKKVAVLGGGAVAADCATTAKRLGAASVELVYRRRVQDMPLTQYEREMLLEHGIEIAVVPGRSPSSTRASGSPAFVSPA